MSRLKGFPVALLLVLILAFLALGVTHLLKPVENVVAQLFLPLQRSLDSLGERFTNLGHYFQDLETLTRQNEELQELVDHLVIENIRLREAEIENITLRQQLGFKEATPDYQLLSTRVIGRDPSNLVESITIDRGSDDGIAVGLPVVTSQGLVGRVVEAYPRSSRVLLITDVSSSVNALIQNSRATGVIQGKPGGGIVMRYIQQGEEIEVGDLVLTSGLGGNLPRRLVIGQVTAVRQKDIEIFQEAEIEPTVEFDHLEMVMIITDFEE